MARILKEDAERRLASVPAEYVFRCYDGRTFSDMNELGQALAGMADETFAYHSNEERSDFSNWVRDVIGDEKLARDLAKSQSPAQAAKSVAERVNFLSSKLT